MIIKQIEQQTLNQPVRGFPSWGKPSDWSQRGKRFFSHDQSWWGRMSLQWPTNTDKSYRHVTKNRQKHPEVFLDKWTKIQAASRRTDALERQK